MDITAYLSQAFALDNSITAKLDQISSLKALAARITSSVSEQPVSHTRNLHSMEDAVCRIIDMEEELNGDIGRLIDLKRSIQLLVSGLENPIQRTVLEYRYLCFKSWDEIADLMGYTRSNVLKLHKKALAALSASYEECVC